MLVTFFRQLKDGKEYAKVWPNRKELTLYFVEHKVIALLKATHTLLVPGAVLVAALQYHLLGAESLPQIIASALFLLSIPVQAELWLGHRATSKLPPFFHGFYRDLHAKMKQAGYDVNIKTHQPRFADLARLLRDMYDKTDKAFQKELF